MSFRKEVFMSTLNERQKTYLIWTISLIVVCELLLKTNNMIAQVLAIILVPIMAILVLKIMLIDQKKEINNN